MRYIYTITITITITLYSAQYSVLLSDIIFLNCIGGKQKQENALQIIQLPALQLQLKIWHGCYFLPLFLRMLKRIGKRKVNTLPDSTKGAIRRAF